MRTLAACSPRSRPRTRPGGTPRTGILVRLEDPGRDLLEGDRRGRRFPWPTDDRRPLGLAGPVAGPADRGAAGLSIRATQAPRRPSDNGADVARREKVRVFPVGASPTRRTQSLQPEAIGAAAEVTKPPKPSRQRVALATRRAGRPYRE